MILRKLQKDEWKEFSERAHLLVFEERIDADNEFIDFAYLCGVEGQPYAYATCRQVDPGVVYLKYGGIFPAVRGTAVSYKAYKNILDDLKNSFEKGITLIQNTNKAMIKFALSYGWVITGVRVFEGDVMVEFTINFKEV